MAMAELAKPLVESYHFSVFGKQHYNYIFLEKKQLFNHIRSITIHWLCVYKGHKFVTGFLGYRTLQVPITEDLYDIGKSIG